MPRLDEELSEHWFKVDAFVQDQSWRYFGEIGTSDDDPEMTIEEWAGVIWGSWAKAAVLWAEGVGIVARHALGQVSGAVEGDDDFV